MRQTPLRLTVSALTLTMMLMMMLTMMLTMMFVVMFTTITHVSAAHAEGYYKLTLTHLTVNEQRANGKAWDLRDGLPDLFISVYINGATVIQRPLGRDATSVDVEVESAAFDIVDQVKLEVIVYDKDLSEDDYIDHLTAMVKPQELGELTYQKGLIKRIDFTLSLTRAGRESVARQVAELRAKAEEEARREAEVRAKAAETRREEAVKAKQRAEAQTRAEREARVAAEERARRYALERPNKDLRDERGERDEREAQEAPNDRPSAPAE